VDVCEFGAQHWVIDKRQRRGAANSGNSSKLGPVPSENLIGVFVDNPEQLFGVRLRANADQISVSTQR
jgi:hypothetical protein